MRTLHIFGRDNPIYMILNCRYSKDNIVRYLFFFKNEYFNGTLKFSFLNIDSNVTFGGWTNQDPVKKTMRLIFTTFLIREF